MGPGKAGAGCSLAFRGFGVSAIALLLTCLLPGCGPAPEPSAVSARPNILLVSIDSLRPDHLGCYGYERDTSPNIDALARAGLRFSTVLSPTSWTLPAHATLFTALPPEGHGLRVDATALTDQAITLAEVLQSARYETAAFVGGPFLRSMYGLQQGFDSYDESVVREFRASQKGSTSPQLTGAVQTWLDGWDSRGREQPFFVFLHLWDVHYDYAPPPPYDTLFDPDYTGNLDASDYETSNRVRADMDPRDLEHLRALYDGEIRYTDEHLGRLLANLAARGLEQNTLVIVTSDHGEEFFEHGAKGHRKNLFEPSLRVPLVLRWPGHLPAGRVLDDAVRLMDVPVTVLALAGVTAPFGFGFQGEGAPIPLTSLLDADVPRPVLPSFGELNGSSTSARLDDWKLVRTRKRSGQVLESLHRLSEGEAVSDEPAPQALRDLLDNWMQRWAQRRPLSVEIELSDEQQEHLRALGYLR